MKNDFIPQLNLKSNESPIGSYFHVSIALHLIAYKNFKCHLM